MASNLNQMAPMKGVQDAPYHDEGGSVITTNV